MSYTTRSLTPSDFSALAALAHRVWHTHYISLISAEQIDYMLSLRTTPEALADQLAYSACYLVMEDAGGTVCGYGSARALADIEHPVLRGEGSMEGAYFLSQCYLAPECQGKGLGRVLFEAVCDTLPALCRMRLQVNRGNATAIRFYEKLGFEKVAELDLPIGGTNGADFVMADDVMQRISR